MRDPSITLVPDELPPGLNRKQFELSCLFMTLYEACAESEGKLTERLVNEVLPKLTHELAVFAGVIPEPTEPGPICFGLYQVSAEYRDTFIRNLAGPMANLHAIMDVPPEWEEYPPAIVLDFCMKNHIAWSTTFVERIAKVRKQDPTTVQKRMVDYMKPPKRLQFRPYDKSKVEWATLLHKHITDTDTRRFGHLTVKNLLWIRRDAF
jgi:hypothetical protein